MRRLGRAGILLAAVVAPACGPGTAQPADLDARSEACAQCRMAVSDPRLASQIVAPGELPRFFDDHGCLATFLKAGRAPERSTVFVADHRTSTWIDADRAVFTRVPGLATPMGSHLLAHADAASRDADPDARGGTAVPASDIFGPSGPPRGEAK